MPYQQRRRVADGVLMNDGSVAELRKKAERFWVKVVSK
jgi:hypothetical protein